MRQWRLLKRLSESPRGRTVDEYVSGLDVSRATFYRDIDVLESAGFAIVKETRDGSVLYRIPPDVSIGKDVAPAISIARIALASLPPGDVSNFVGNISRGLRPIDHEMVETVELGSAALIEDAIRQKEVVHIEYADSEQRSSQRTVEPLRISHRDDGAHLIAFDRSRDALKHFELVRVRSVKAFGESCPLRKLDLEAFEADLERVNDLAKELVAVKIAASAAHAVWERPLSADQKVIQSEAGVIVSTRVDNLAEAKTWVLSWGGAAEVLQPQVLREDVRDEYHKALAPYLVWEQKKDD